MCVCVSLQRPPRRRVSLVIRPRGRGEGGRPHAATGGSQGNGEDSPTEVSPTPPLRERRGKARRVASVHNQVHNQATWEPPPRRTRPGLAEVQGAYKGRPCRGPREGFAQRPSGQRDIFTGSPAVQVGKHVYHVTRLSHPVRLTIFRLRAERPFSAASVMALTRRIGAARGPPLREVVSDSLPRGLGTGMFESTWPAWAKWCWGRG